MLSCGLQIEKCDRLCPLDILHLILSIGFSGFREDDIGSYGNDPSGWCEIPDVEPGNAVPVCASRTKWRKLFRAGERAGEVVERVENGRDTLKAFQTACTKLPVTKSKGPHDCWASLVQ